MTKTKSFNKNAKRKALYHAFMESILANEDAMDKGVADIQKKRKLDDGDRDEDPPTGPDQGLRKRNTCKDTKQSKKVKSTGTSKGTTKSQLKSTGKSAQAKETVFEDGDTQADLKDWFKKPKRPPTLDPEWNKGKTVDNKPTQKWSAKKLLKELAQRVMSSLEYNMEEMNKIVPVDYFFNNDLAYLQGGSTGRTYTTSLTKTKAAKYNLQGSEYMAPNL
ncbi:hypothetical protein Tco_1493387 [Tanacetum coccineum]